jgi:hypothetical protein
MRSGRPIEDEPQDAEVITQIVKLRDTSNLTWREIGPMFDMTHMGAYLLYKKWRDWCYEEENQ